MTVRPTRFVTAARPLVAAAVMFAGLHATAGPAAAVQFCNTTPVIGNGGLTSPPLASSPYPSTITISGMSGTLSDVNVTLLGFTTRADSNGFHWAEDIDVLLVAPTGANVVPMSDAGGNNDVSSGQVSGANLTLDDQAANQLPADSHLMSGSWRPVDDDDDVGDVVPVDEFPAPAPAPSASSALSTFNGIVPNGTWSLYLVDDMPGASSDLVGGWCLDILTSGPAAPNLSVGDVKITEGDSRSRVAQFPVSLSAPSSSTVTVTYATADGSAVQPDDYTARSGTLSFAPGQVTRFASVPIRGDRLDEVSETFTVRLSAPVNATIADGVGLGTIRDDDPQSGVRITISDVKSREGASGLHALAFTVSLSKPSVSTVTVQYTTGDSTATQPGDYIAKSGTLTFIPGVVSRRITVSTVADTSLEATEAFRVMLSAATGGAVIADSLGIGTLVNDD